jgi:hypothetical protein
MYDPAVHLGREVLDVRIRVAMAVGATLVSSLALASTATADTAIPLVRPAPSWYTPQLHAQVIRAGADGVKVRQEELNIDCPGFQGLRGSHLGEGVSAGGCIVAPFGCTANFIFTGGGSKYIGTARHCVKPGEPVVMQVDTVTIAAVGTVAKTTPGKCPDGLFETGPGCEVGHDFALIKLYSDVVKRWGVNPALPVGGPRGVYRGCDPQPVKHWGHGYEAATAQGKPEGGLATNWREDGYGWTGVGFGGDSGSGVVLADNRAAGNFTHLIVNTRYPGSNLAGMRATAILQLVGSKIKLVNADGSTSRSGPADCPRLVPGGPLNQAGSPVQDVEQAVDDAGEAVDEAREEVEDAGDKVEDAADKVGGTVRDAL